MIQQLDQADIVRREVAPRMDLRRKSTLGQFMTPSSVARFMADMFPPSQATTCRLLDAGAGVGALSCAFLDRWMAGGFGFQSVDVSAYEIDDELRSHLTKNLGVYPGVRPHVLPSDFIMAGVADVMLCCGGYTHAILNPPYKKIGSRSKHRIALRSVGIETVNLYSAFVALAVALAAPGGQIVAIIPRSFCNGPYYRPFREFVLARAAIRQLHLFESRSKAFKDDGVLQENVIIRLERGAAQGPVEVSTSTDDTFADLVRTEHPFAGIVFPGDRERFIHVPTAAGSPEVAGRVRCSLADIGVKVSTGPVVDFRLQAFLRDMPEEGAVPLLYPGHFSGGSLRWPKPDLRKPNAIMRTPLTERWLYPNGFYCVVRRFSSKEERRRIVATVVNPDAFGDVQVLGLENHLNVLHEDKHGLSKALAYGLAAFLNTTAVDERFRRFSGHTQVNATDLKQMLYPSRDTLLALGEWAMHHDDLPQEALDAKVTELTA